jgi:hypothetical protein
MNAMPNGVNGRAFMDTECQVDATSANLPNAARFVAFVPTSSETMVGRLGTGPWIRPDGVTFLAADHTVLAPLDVTPTLDYVDTQVWGGTNGIDQLPQLTDDCNDWDSTGTNGLVGRASRSSSVEMVNAGSDNCFVNHYIYCIDP